MHPALHHCCVRARLVHHVMISSPVPSYIDDESLGCMGLRTGQADRLHLRRSLRTAYEHRKAVCKLLVGIVNIIITFKWGAGLG